MIVRDLMDQLEKLPSNLEIVLAEDAEGNGFSPLEEIEWATWEIELNYGVAPKEAVVFWPV